MLVKRFKLKVKIELMKDEGWFIYASRNRRIARNVKFMRP